MSGSVRKFLTVATNRNRFNLFVKHSCCNQNSIKSISTNQNPLCAVWPFGKKKKDEELKEEGDKDSVDK